MSESGTIKAATIKNAADETLDDIKKATNDVIKSIDDYFKQSLDDLKSNVKLMVDGYLNEATANKSDAIEKDEVERHEEVMKGMRDAIEKNESINYGGDSKEVTQKGFEGGSIKPSFDSSVVVKPELPVEAKPVEKVKEVETIKTKPSIIRLANSDFSVATIAKEANRIKERDEGEVFISLH